tara:strand:+ start:253 stop:582 length:330 start_codon:yes stop_codon:yes gene_type:complete
MSVKLNLGLLCFADQGSFTHKSSIVSVSVKPTEKGTEINFGYTAGMDSFYLDLTADKIPGNAVVEFVCEDDDLYMVWESENNPVSFKVGEEEQPLTKIKIKMHEKLSQC